EDRQWYASLRCSP
ncbi:alanine racemase, partial [Vibrio parahaemolyticus V-223/04]